MKKLLLLLLLLPLVIFSQTSTSIVTLNVRLYPIQTIVVNTTQTSVNLDYTTATNYTNGVTTLQPNHLSVYSTGGFVVSVKSQDVTLTNTINSDFINSSDIKILASEGSANSLAGVSYNSEISLSTTAQPIFSKATGGVNKNFNITYTVKGNLDTYINKYYNSQNPTVYSTTVIYEITPI